MTIGSLIQSLYAGTFTNPQLRSPVTYLFFLQEGKLAAENRTTDRTV
jgi:hypothetical protein